MKHTRQWGPTVNHSIVSQRYPLFVTWRLGRRSTLRQGNKTIMPSCIRRRLKLGLNFTTCTGIGLRVHVWLTVVKNASQLVFDLGVNDLDLSVITIVRDVLKSNVRWKRSLRLRKFVCSEAKQICNGRRLAEVLNSVWEIVVIARRNQAKYLCACNMCL